MTYIRDHQGDDWLFLYCYYQSCTCPSLGWVCLYKNNDIKNTLPLSFTRSLKIIAQIKILTSVPYHPEPCLPSLASSQTHNQFQNCINNIQGPPWPGTSLHNRITEPLLLRPSCRVIRSQPVNLLPVHISNPQFVPSGCQNQWKISFKILISTCSHWYVTYSLSLFLILMNGCKSCILFL